MTSLETIPEEEAVSSFPSDQAFDTDAVHVSDHWATLFGDGFTTLLDISPPRELAGQSAGWNRLSESAWAMIVFAAVLCCVLVTLSPFNAILLFFLAKC